MSTGELFEFRTDVDVSLKSPVHIYLKLIKEWGTDVILLNVDSGIIIKKYLLILYSVIVLLTTVYKFGRGPHKKIINAEPMNY